MTIGRITIGCGRSATLRLALVGAALVLLTAFGPLAHKSTTGYVHWAIIAATAAGAAWATFNAEYANRRSALIVIAVVAVAMRLAQLAIEPYLSDDIYRYVWDGRVQAAGINPYRYIPIAPELGHLRDEAIYPLINRADFAPTIYPPAAQVFYLLVTRVSESVIFMKLALVACEGVAIAATSTLLTRLGLPATRIAAVAWHPLSAWEIAGSGHVDALMTAGLMVALVSMAGGRPLAAGVIATAAALVKPTALLVLPVLWKPWRFALPAVVAATALLLYVPYLSVGWKVFGFLSGYVADEGLNKAYGFRYLALIDGLIVQVPHGAAVYASLFGTSLLALAFVVSFRRDRSLSGSLAATTVLIVTFLVFLTPHYPWYYLVLVPFLAFYPWSVTLWAMTIGGMQSYHAVPNDPIPDYYLRQYVFIIFVLVALAWDGVRIRRVPQLLDLGAARP